MLIWGKEKAACGQVCRKYVTSGLDFTTLLFHTNMVKGEYTTSALTFTLPMAKQTSLRKTISIASQIDCLGRCWEQMSGSGLSLYKLTFTNACMLISQCVDQLGRTENDWNFIIGACWPILKQEKNHKFSI